MEMDGAHFANYPKNKFSLVSAAAATEVAHFIESRNSGQVSAGV